jgi:hypothetical protein
MAQSHHRYDTRLLRQLLFPRAQGLLHAPKSEPHGVGRDAVQVEAGTSSVTPATDLEVS